jgi:Ca-activated chloride channel family protein
VSDISFVRPWILLALAIVPLALTWWWVGLAKGAVAARKISRENPARPAYLSAALMALAASAAIIAAAQPRWGTETSEVPRVGAELVVVIDVSRSMDSRDVAPSRLQAAKTAILAAFARMGGDRVGVVIFAGSGRLRFPLTGDLDAASQVVDSLETGAILVEGGSNAASGLELALSAFDFERDAGRAVLLISDGDDLGADPVGAITRLKAANVTLIVAGIGTTAGGTVPVYDPQKRTTVDKKDAAGAPIITKLNEPFLKAAAAAAGGRYLGSDPQVIPGSVTAILASLERTRIEQRSTQIPIERFPAFVIVALGALVLASITERLPNLRPRRAAKYVPTTIIALLIFGCASEAHSVNERALAAFDSGDTDTAVTLFFEAQSLEPDNPVVSLNLARALDRAGRYDEAIGAARRALTSNNPRVRSQAHASLGHHQFSKGQLAAALQSFKQALLLDPRDPASQHDYEVVLRLLFPPPRETPGEDGAPDATPSPGANETPEAGQGNGTPGTPQPNATPPPGQGTPIPGSTPGAGRPSSVEDIEKQLAGIDAQIAQLMRASGEQPTAEQALEILKLIEERSRLAGIRDAFRGGDRPRDY